jgi:peptide/nickel transport system permease protein
VGSQWLLRRLLGAALTIFAIAVLNFFLFRALPGDPATTLLPRNVSDAQKESLRRQLGLDQPLIPGVIRTNQGAFKIDLSTLPGSITQNQFLTYLGNLVNLNLGQSFAEERPVVDVIADHFWPTVLLVGVAEILSIAVGMLIGIRAAWKRGGAFDVISVNASLVIYAVPFFWLGMLLLYFLATPHGIPIFPGQQMQTLGVTFSNPLDQAVDIGRHLALPALTLGLGLLGEEVLIMRSSMLEALREDYVTTARAKGLREGDVVRRHVVPNALLPTVTVVALTLGYVLGGAIGVEEVFAWPGMGRLTVDAIHEKDFPVLQGLFLIIAICVVAANLLADIVYLRLDPRVRT